MKSRIILQLFCVLPMLALTLAVPSAHVVPAISGGTLHLTTTQGVTGTQYNTLATRR